MSEYLDLEVGEVIKKGDVYFSDAGFWTDYQWPMHGRLLKSLHFRPRRPIEEVEND